VARDEEVSQYGVGLQIDCSVVNPPQMRQKGGGCAPLSVKGSNKFK
jgi:hypothetical protein